MKFAVVTLGSAGDLHPFLAVARALLERGHEVHVLSQAPYAPAVQDEGAHFIPIAGQLDHDRTLNHPLLWHPLHGFGVLWRHLAVPALGPTIDALDGLSRTGPLTVFASPLAAGARLAREAWPDRIRLLSGYTAPMGLRSTADPMFLGAWRVPAWLPEAAKRALWWALDRWKLEPLARPAVRRWTDSLKLSPLGGSLFGEALHSPDGGIALFPDWFAPVPPDWAQRGVMQTGFPVFEPTAAHATSVALHDFLEDSRPFAVVYPGSAERRAREFAKPVLPACEALDLRVLLLSRFFPDQSPAKSCILPMAHCPLGKVLPAAAVFVHHGGIGSAAQGLSAGVNQLVLASAYDQFENGSRLERLGQGRWQPLAEATLAAVHDAIEGLLHRGARSPALIQPPQASWAQAPNSAVRETCELLENRGVSRHLNRPIGAQNRL